MNSRDDQQKLRVLAEDAALGIARAQRLLALRFLRGRGVPRDIATGLEWLRRAAEQAAVERGVA
ncbi:MAG: SEL1-like repeat protein [Pseudomonadota bacterium]